MTTFLDLHSHEGYAAVVDLQRAIWGRQDDNIPAWVLAASVERGAILIGAEEDGRLVGFVYSVPGLKAGHPMQWSHLLGVLPGERRGGLGLRLKLAQRERALARGHDLIEWTFDPLVATNGRLNVARLGAVIEEYLENVYGTSTSPLHAGAPTDRFVATWRIDSPHVRRRLEAGPMVVRDARVAEAPSIVTTREHGTWRVPDGAPRLDDESERVTIEIPFGFVDMLREAPDVALDWRLTTRAAFSHYFSRGYRVVEYFGDRASNRAAYLLQRTAED